MNHIKSNKSNINLTCVKYIIFSSAWHSDGLVQANASGMLNIIIITISWPLKHHKTLTVSLWHRPQTGNNYVSQTLKTNEQRGRFSFGSSNHFFFLCSYLYLYLLSSFHVSPVCLRTLSFTTFAHSLFLFRKACAEPRCSGNPPVVMTARSPIPLSQVRDTKLSQALVFRPRTPRPLETAPPLCLGFVSLQTGSGLSFGGKS